MNIATYNESWDGHTGEEIKNWITDKLESLDEAFVGNDTPEVNKELGTVTIPMITRKGEVKNIVFSTVSEAEVLLKYFYIDGTVPTYIPVKQDLEINYRFSSINKEGNARRDKITLTYSITHDDGSVTTGTTVSIERSLMDSEQPVRDTLTIPYSSLKPGLNTITINGQIVISDSLRSPIETVSAQVTQIDLQAEVSANKYIVTNDESINLSAVVKNAGKDLDNTLSDLIRYNVTYASNTSPNNRLGAVTLNEINNNVAVRNLRVDVYFEAYIDGYPNITSNISKLGFINKYELSNNSVYANFNLTDTEIGSNTITISQYSSYNFLFNVYNNGLDSTTIKLNKETYDTIALESGDNVIEFIYSFPTVGQYKFVLGGSTLTINVQALDTSLQEPTDYVYYVTANGKRTGSTATDGWDGDFVGFNWIDNGWKDGALLINNGASFTPNYFLYQEIKPYTISIKCKATGNIVEDLIKCLNYNTGFSINNEGVSIYHGTNLYQTLNMSNTHEITLVYYGNNAGIYSNLFGIYINGKVQRVLTSGDSIAHFTKILFTAQDSNLYLYSIKIFERALSFPEILALYIFNQLENSIIDYVNRNNIFASNSLLIGEQDISINKVPDGSIILLLEAFDRPWYTINSYGASEENKGMKHALTNMRLYVKGVEADARNFYAKGGCLSAQGTSSMYYPIKNFRIYWNKKADVIPELLDSTIYDGNVIEYYQGTSSNPLPATSVGVGFTPTTGSAATKGYQLFSTEYGDSYTSAKANRFCLKADYAESSGTHNTGFARFAEDIIKNSETIVVEGVTGSQELSGTPPQHSESSYDIRMNVDGRPIYLFFKDSETGVIEYAGRYNMNNDKSNVKVFGFEGADDYYNNEKVQETVQKFLNDTQDTSSDLYSIDPNYATTHKMKDGTINPTECWEFSANDGPSTLIGAFYVPNGFTSFKGKDSVFKTLNGLDWINKVWEYRYPDYDEGSNADYLYRSGASKPYYLYKTYQFLYENNYAINPENLNTFARDLHLYFNVNSVLKYYVLTQWFANVDQRIKNSMLAFYVDPYGVSETEANLSPLYYVRAFYIFYDNDTILGLRNDGVVAIPWNIWETDENSFPGKGMHGLWNNLQACYEQYLSGQQPDSESYLLGEAIVSAYKALRTAGTDLKIKTYFETQQCKYYPDAVQNLDLEVKYLKSTNLTSSDSTGLDKFYGTREYHREVWLKKRTDWFDNFYEVSGLNNTIGFKTNAISEGSKLLTYGNVYLTKADNYRFCKFCIRSESNNTVYTNLINNSNKQGFSVGKSSNSGYNAIGGLDAAKTFDFSDYKFYDENSGSPIYLETFTTNGICKNLTDLIIRSFDKSPAKMGGMAFKDLIINSVFPNLEKLVICNIQGYSEQTASTIPLEALNLTNFNKLKELDIRGSNFSGLTLPESQSLERLYVFGNKVNAISNINISNKPNITDITLPTTRVSLISVDLTNKLVYTYVLNIAKTNPDININVHYGRNIKDQYEISKDELELLVELKNNSNLTVSGFVYYPGEEEVSGVTDLENVWTNLVISRVIGTPVLSIKGDISQLREDAIDAVFEADTVTNLQALQDSGNLLHIGSNVKIINWDFRVGDDNNGYGNMGLGDRIRIVNSDQYNCYLHANPSGLNTSETNILSVRGAYIDEENNTKYVFINNIPITYILLSRFTLNPANKGYGTTDLRINISLDNSTKKYLLNTSSLIIDGLESADTYDTSNFPEYITITNFGGDRTLTVELLPGLTASVDIYKNSVFYNTNSPDDAHRWINILFPESIGITDITPLQAAKVNLSSLWDNLVNTLVNEQLQGSPTLTLQDFSYLKYFTWGSTSTFPIPGAVNFNNLTTPMGATFVNWESMNQQLSYEVITLSKYVNKFCMHINPTALPTALLIDMSKTNITTIANTGSTTPDYTANIEIILNATSPSTTVNNLFIYPNTLTLIGNTDISMDLNSGAVFNAMFNLLNNNTNTRVMLQNQAQALPPLYRLSGLAGLTSNNIVVGVISSYKIDSSVFGDEDYTKIVSYIGTFAHGNFGNFGNSGLNLGSVQTIGKLTFFSNKLSISKNYYNSVKHIGNYAFSGASSTTANGKWSSVESIGERAFQGLDNGLEVYFTDNLKTVDPLAFYNGTSNTFIIHFGSEEITMPSNIFDGDGKFEIYASGALYEQLNAAYSRYSNIKISNNDTL